MIRISLVLLFLLFEAQAHSKEFKVVSLDHKFCTSNYHTIKLNEENDYLDVFCEGALGNYVGFSFRGVQGVPNKKLADRYWQDANWAKNVTAVAWLSGSDEVYVSTSAEYGSAGVFRLNFEKRRALNLVEGGKNHSSITSYKILSLAKDKLEFVEGSESGNAVKSLKIFH